MIIVICKDLILKTDRVWIVDVDNAETNILAKSQHETINIGAYGRIQARKIFKDIQETILGEVDFYIMPARCKP